MKKPRQIISPDNYCHGHERKAGTSLRVGTAFWFDENDDAPLFEQACNPRSILGGAYLCTAASFDDPFNDLNVAIR